MRETIFFFKDRKHVPDDEERIAKKVIFDDTSKQEKTRLFSATLKKI
jgi:hypothetical protein